MLLMHQWSIKQERNTKGKEIQSQRNEDGAGVEGKGNWQLRLPNTAKK